MNERQYQTDTLRQNLESVMTTYMRFAQENQDLETTKTQEQTWRTVGIHVNNTHFGLLFAQFRDQNGV